MELDLRGTWELAMSLGGVGYMLVCREWSLTKIATRIVWGGPQIVNRVKHKRILSVGHYGLNILCFFRAFN